MFNLKILRINQMQEKKQRSLENTSQLINIISNEINNDKRNQIFFYLI